MRQITEAEENIAVHRLQMEHQVPCRIWFVLHCVQKATERDFFSLLVITLFEDYSVTCSTAILKKKNYG